MTPFDYVKGSSVLGMGIIPFDLLYTIDKYPAAESKIDALDFHTQSGGPVPNCLVGLSRLGVKTSIIAVVGDDLIGKQVIKELKNEGVGHNHMIVKHGRSAIATGYIERASGRRTMVLYRNISIKPSDFKLSDLAVPTLVHLDGRDMAATMKLARWAKRKGALVSFDVGSPRFDVAEVFPLVDHLVVADSFAFPFTKARTAKTAARKLAKFCPGVITVTEGIRGATALDHGSYWHQKAFKVKMVDTTGAGDAFHAGYLYGLLNNLDLSQCLRWGAAVAALKCGQPGGQSGLPNITQVRKFIKSEPEKYG